MKYLFLLSLPLTWGQARQHVESTIVLHLNAAPSEIFPLFGPVREAEWAKGWDPRILYPEDRAQIAGTTFTIGEGADQQIWILTTYDPKNRRASYAYFEPGIAANQIEISIQAAPGGTSEASVTYKRTALSEAGDRAVAQFKQRFPSHRAHWEDAINTRLKALQP